MPALRRLNIDTKDTVLTLDADEIEVLQYDKRKKTLRIFLKSGTEMSVTEFAPEEYADTTEFVWPTGKEKPDE